MMYLFLICYEPGVPRGPDDPPSLQPQHAALTKELRAEGRMISGGALMPYEMKPIARVRGTTRLGIDGPYAETKEVVGGYYAVECSDPSDAESVAMRIPVSSNAWVQIRPMFLYDHE